MTRRVAVLLSLVALCIGASAAAQSEAPLIDSPPGVVTDPPATPSVGMRPGEIVVLGRPLRLRLLSEQKGITYHVKVGESYGEQSGVAVGFGGGFGWHGWGYGAGGVMPYAGQSYSVHYRPICTAPCEITLISGVHRFAVSLNEREPLNLPALDFQQSSNVSVKYVDRRRLRRIGLAVFLVSTFLGAGLTLGGLNYGVRGEAIRYKPMFYTGVTIWAAGTISGLALMFQQDKAKVSVQP